MAANSDPQTLLTSIRNGKTVKIRTETMLRGVMQQAQAAHTSTNAKAFQEWNQQLTTAIPEYAAAVEGGQTGQTSGAGGK